MSTEGRSGHHQKYRSRQGNDSLANLVTLSAYCHIQEHGQLSYSRAAAKHNSARKWEAAAEGNSR